MSKRKKNLHKLFRIAGFISAIFGLLLLILFLISLKFDGFNISFTGKVDLDSSAKFGDFLAGTLGPIWALASVFFFLEALTLQREELNELKKNNQNKDLSTLILKLIDFLDLNSFSIIFIQRLLSIQSYKIYITFGLLHGESILKINDFEQVDEVLALIKTKLTQDELLITKQRYDKAEDHTLDYKTILISLNPIADNIRNITELLLELPNEQKHRYFSLLRAKLGIYGNAYFMILLFYNMIDWSFIEYYTMWDINVVFRDSINIRHAKDEELIFEKALLKIYKEERKN